MVQGHKNCLLAVYGGGGEEFVYLKLSTQVMQAFCVLYVLRFPFILKVPNHPTENTVHTCMEEKKCMTKFL